MVQRYKKDEFIDALEFNNTTPENHQAIIDFTGCRISVEYPGGSESVQLRVIRGTYTVLRVKLGEWIVKEANGALKIYTLEALNAEYDLVETES